ncbi:MAG: glycosyltransferase family 39 protein, partial [Dehalococcoidia bacterium]|nr:glycosyltransferase family 39 protein [Dehalococcoidia bacterium]
MVALLLFTFVLAIYLQTFGAVFYSIDEDIYLRTTQSLVERGTFAITPIEYSPQFSVARGLDGQMYANRGPGFPIVAVPFYLLGDALASLGSPHTAPTRDGIEDPTVFTLSLTLANALIVAATVALLFVTLKRLGYGRPASTAAALLLAFGTMAWSYASKSFFAEPLLALCLLGAFYCVLRYRQGSSLLMLLIAGALVGWGMLTKVTAFALVPWLAAYAVWPDKGWHFRWQQVLTRLAWLAAGVVPFVVAWMTFNYLRFGDILTTGYELEGGVQSVVT